jgi:excisionase family DNA binding protein
MNTPQNNSNNTRPYTTDMPQHLQQCIQDTVSSMLDGILWCRVQCITIEEAAECMNVYHDTVRQWIKAGLLPASKAGREWRIRLIDLDQFITQTTQVVKIDKRMKKHRLAS